MNMLWIRIIGPNLRSQKLEVPLSPSSKLSWLGLSDLYSPTIMDTDGTIKMYDKKSSMWRVACNTDRHVSQETLALHLTKSTFSQLRFCLFYIAFSFFKYKNPFGNY